MSSSLIEKDSLFAFEYKMSHFCNAIGCEGHSNPLRYVLADYPKRFYYISKRNGFCVFVERTDWFAVIVKNATLVEDFII